MLNNKLPMFMQGGLRRLSTTASASLEQRCLKPLCCFTEEEEALRSAGTSITCTPV